MAGNTHNASVLARGLAGATKLERQFTEEPAEPDKEDLMSEASALHRRFYGEWPTRKPSIRVWPVEGGET